MARFARWQGVAGHSVEPEELLRDRRGRSRSTRLRSSSALPLADAPGQNRASARPVNRRDAAPGAFQAGTTLKPLQKEESRSWFATAREVNYRRISDSTCDE